MNDSPIQVIDRPTASERRPPRMSFHAPSSAPSSPTRQAITALTRRPEPELLPGLLAAARLDESSAARVQALALQLARGVRERARDSGRAGLVQGLLQEFSLSSQEGVSLMCLAEALLRIPDAATRDALIRDKIVHGDWQSHLGRSPSLFVNAAAWGLLVTGRLVATHSDTGLSATLMRLIGRGGEPLVRRAVDLAMRLMGEQFVTGQTIAEALSSARAREARGFRFSYDMLGEAALTEADAQRYLAAYAQAIDAIGAASGGRGIVDGPGISIKLSALHPRYARAQAARVMAELLPRLTMLAARARQHGIGLNIDAEEADRLELSLDLLDALAADPALAGWNGLGFVIQAYSKRCPAVVDHLVALARRTGRRLMVRLVKGAYWDSEIKRAQLDGLEGYPVYTRKAYTDLAYLACARRLLAAPDAVYPQFATHNAHTAAAIHEMAGGESAAQDRYEFQCLHGMGEPLYEQVVGLRGQGRIGRPCRIYAPVGPHDTLLAYLVRRLLENGANTSFVHRIADASLSLEALVEDPVRTVEALAAAEGRLGLPHPAIALPSALYGSHRQNSQGLDLASEPVLGALDEALTGSRSETERLRAGSLLAGASQPLPPQPVRNPAQRAEVVGVVAEASSADVATALAAAEAAAPRWAATPPAERARMLDDAAERLQAELPELVALLMREAGKTAGNAVAEVREAVDFLRYDAAELRALAAPALNTAADALQPLGPVVCISPWNFPLAIFIGQVAVALAAGNPVLAKPAEQTPLVAARAVQALHAAGVPREVLQLLPGRGDTVGAALVADARVQGVMFTGSTAVAQRLQQVLSARLGALGRPVPLVAETGGQNALVVDSSALAEQVVADALASAFDSAGQRCSALRLLCVQREAADRVQELLEGAMREQTLGDAQQLATDIGPVIDAEARVRIDAHLAALQARGRRITQPLRAASAALNAAGGCFVAPAVVEIERIDELTEEVFGPVLHLLRYDREQLPAVLEAINATGYGLTGGVHTRIDETVAQVAATLRVGNLYVNRNTVGAVVGVQPFGGEGLSGTGPKAGGPLALTRLMAGRPEAALRRAVERSGPLAAGGVPGHDARPLQEAGAEAARDALRAWAGESGKPVPHVALGLAAWMDRVSAANPAQGWRQLSGPTGEANFYAALPRDTVLCLAADDAMRLKLLAAAMVVGARALLPAEARALVDALPPPVRDRVRLTDDWTAPAARFDAVLHQGGTEERLSALAALAQRTGALVSLFAADEQGSLPMEALVVERSISVNTTAAGGNASLMTMG